MATQHHRSMDSEEPNMTSIPAGLLPHMHTRCPNCGAGWCEEGAVLSHALEDLLPEESVAYFSCHNCGARWSRWPYTDPRGIVVAKFLESTPKEETP